MKSPLKIGLNLLTLGLIWLGVYNANKAEAINDINSGWQVAGNYAISTLEWCAVVSNPSTTVFVPTISWAEWNAFKSVAPSRGIWLMGCDPYIATYGDGGVGDACGGAWDCAGDAGGDSGDF